MEDDSEKAMTPSTSLLNLRKDDYDYSSNGIRNRKVNSMNIPDNDVEKKYISSSYNKFLSTRIAKFKENNPKIFWSCCFMTSVDVCAGIYYGDSYLTKLVPSNFINTYGRTSANTSLTQGI